MIMKILSQQRLKEVLDYEPKTGVFTRRIHMSSNARAGEKAGSITSCGRVCIRVDGALYLAHRLAFLWVEGQFPPNDVDHINGVPTDNRWDNLRHATRQENCCNVAAIKGGASRYLGVDFYRATKRWRAQICRNRKKIHLGYFDNKRDAAMAYDKAAKEIHGEFANLNFGGKR